MPRDLDDPPHSRSSSVDGGSSSPGGAGDLRVSAFAREESWIGRLAVRMGEAGRLFGRTSENFSGKHAPSLAPAVREANEQGSPEHRLTESQTSAITRFYDLKLERQMRGLFRLAAAKTLDACLAKLEESLHKNIGKGTKGCVPFQCGGSPKPFALCHVDRVPPVDELPSGVAGQSMSLTVAELRHLRRDVLCLLEPHTLSKSQSAIVSAYRETVKAEVIDRLRAGVEVPPAALTDLNWRAVRDIRIAIAEIRGGSSSAPPTTEVIHNVESQLRRTDRVSWPRVFAMIASHPELTQKLQEQSEAHAANRFAFTVRKVREVVGMLTALNAERADPTGRIVDLCCGTGDLTFVLHDSGYDVSGVEMSSDYLRTGRIYRAVMSAGSPPGSEPVLTRGDILRDPIPDASTWVAKHPCAFGMALPDEIIERFAKSEADDLFLLTCCAFRSIGCCPEPYKEMGLVTDQAWDALCRSSSETQSVETLQRAMRAINMIRLEAIHRRWGDTISATLIEIDGSEMNQLLVLRRKISAGEQPPDSTRAASPE